MKLLGHEEDQVDIRIASDELLLLANTLRGLCQGAVVSEADFEALLGVSHSEAEALLLRIDSVLERLGMTAEDD